MAYGMIVYYLVVFLVLLVDFILVDVVFEIFFWCNVRQYWWIVCWVMWQLGFDDVIVVIVYNFFYGLFMIGKLDEQLNVYYCYDGIGICWYG